MAFIDFAAVKAAVSIEDAVALLSLELTPSGSQLRGPCPVCQRGGDRALVVTPAKGLFVCFGADRKCGGDQLALVAHISGLSVREAAEWLAGTVTVQPEPVTSNQLLVSKKRATAPQAQQKAATTRETTRAEFDPVAFLEKLEYTEEVAATGLSEEDANALGVGFYRGKLYQAVRWPNGDIAAFTHPEGSSLKFPKTLVRPREAKVVPIPKRA